MEKKILNPNEISPISVTVHKELLGVVLCGGLSSRMGKDKGILKIRGKHWAEHCREILMEFFGKVVLSINQNQLVHYEKFFRIEDLVLDSFSVKGPLKGILSTHREYSQNDLFILACDMISMQSDAITLLLNAYKNHSGFDFYIFKNKGRIEPLCGIYTSNGLKKVELQFAALRTDSHSVMNILENNKTFFLESDSNIESYFRNYNSPEDTKILEL